MSQAELADAPTTETSSVFERVRARRGLAPNVKLAVLIDRRPETAHLREHAVIAFEPGTAWYELMPEEQIARIVTRAQADEEAAHARAVFAHWWNYGRHREPADR
jgi:hypothetical protein